MEQRWRWVMGIMVVMGGYLGVSSMAQPSPSGAPADIAGSTSANGGTGGVGLGGAGSTGTGALVGPRARKKADALIEEQPALQEQAPRNSGQRAILLDKAQRPAAVPSPQK